MSLTNRTECVQFILNAITSTHEKIVRAFPQGINSGPLTLLMHFKREHKIVKIDKNLVRMQP